MTAAHLRAVVLRFWRWVAALVLIGVMALLAWCERPRPVVQIQQNGTDRVLLPRGDIRPQDVLPFVGSPVVVPTVRAVTQNGVTVTAVGVTSGTVQIPPVFTKSEQPPTPVQVEAVAVAGTDRAGVPTLTLDLFQVEDGKRIPLGDSKPMVIVSQPAKPRWRVGLAVQAGVGLTADLAARRAVAAVVDVPWLRQGTGTAEGSVWAALSPALVMAGGHAEPGLLPVSYNLGRHIPLVADVWVSPVVSWALPAGTPRLGVVMTTTF